MEMTPDGGTAVRFNLPDDDIPLIAAILAKVANGQRGYFFAQEGRLPDPGELRSIQSGVIDDWYLMIDRLLEDQQEMRRRLREAQEGE